MAQTKSKQANVKSNDEFYNECSQIAKENYKKYSVNFIKTFKTLALTK